MTDHPPTLNQPPSSARTWDMLCHLSVLSGYLIPFGNLIGPLIIWQIKKNEFSSVDFHGKEAVSFQISVLIYALVSAVLVLVLIGAFLLFALGIATLVLIVFASIRLPPQKRGTLMSVPSATPNQCGGSDACGISNGQIMVALWWSETGASFAQTFELDRAA